MVAMAVLTAGCANESMRKLEDGSMELGWSEPFSGSPLVASGQINNRLYGLCPSGYRKLDEWATGDRENRWYYWKVRCLSDETGGRK
jgi:hypothetical protein